MPEQYFGFKKQEHRPRSVSSYDLRQTIKFTIDQQEFLKKIFDIFSDKFCTNLGGLLQTKVGLKLKQVKLSTHRAYFGNMPDPSNLVSFRIDPETKGIFFLDFALGFALFDRLMGGKGSPLDEIRCFTEIESAILKTAYLKMLESYNQSWRDVLEVNAQFAGLEFNPQSIHISDPSEYLVVVGFQASIAKTTGNFELCIPYPYLKKVLPKESFEEYLLTKTSLTQDSQSSMPIFAKNLEVAKVPVVVELGRVELFFQDILRIEPGDTIKLDCESDKEIRIKVNEKTKFLGRPGIKQGSISVQISKILTEDDEEFEE